MEVALGSRVQVLNEVLQIQQDVPWVTVNVLRASGCFTEKISEFLRFRKVQTGIQVSLKGL